MVSAGKHFADSGAGDFHRIVLLGELPQGRWNQDFCHIKFFFLRGGLIRVGQEAVGVIKLAVL